MFSHDFISTAQPEIFSVSLPSECSAFQLYCQWELELEENAYKFLFSV